MKARHEAETLKDRIKRTKDELADTTRKGALLQLHWWRPMVEGRSNRSPFLTSDSPLELDQRQNTPY